MDIHQYLYTCTTVRNVYFTDEIGLDVSNAGALDLVVVAVKHYLDSNETNSESDTLIECACYALAMSN